MQLPNARGPHAAVATQVYEVLKLTVLKESEEESLIPIRGKHKV